MQAKLIVMATILTTAARQMSRLQFVYWKPIASAFTLPKSRTFVRSFSGAAALNSKSDASEITNERTAKKVGARALIFDTETTGMVRFRDPYTNSSQPDLVQLGFLMVDTADWSIRNQGSFLVKLREEASGIDEAAENIHGISDQDCLTFGIEHATALDIFENLCNNADFVVGHNVRFDVMVMQAAYYRGRNKESFRDLFSSKKQICTMMESIDLCQLPSKNTSNSTSYKWPSLAEAYQFVTGGKDGETLKGAHDALVDSKACLKVFQYLVEHGHVLIDNIPTEIRSDSGASMSLTPEDSNNTVPLSKTENEQEDILSRPEETNTYGTSERNGGIDRSIEIEEEEAHNLYFSEPDDDIERSIEVEEAAAYNFDNDEHDIGIDHFTGAKPNSEPLSKPFDPASFSPDMVRQGRSDQNSQGQDAREEGFRVRGNTYAHKEMIKQLGGRWNSQSKEWVFHENRYLSKLQSVEDLTIVRFSDE